MIRRVWAVLATSLAVVAVFSVLAFAQHPLPAAPIQVMLARSSSGALVPVAIPASGSTHATTQTSPVAGAASTTLAQTGGGHIVWLAGTAAQPVTRAS